MAEIRATKHPGVFTDSVSHYTQNMQPGVSVYGEKLARKGGIEYRQWNPRRSKLAALILKGFPDYPFKPDTSTLYLGAANGTTPSHLSDICDNGVIYCVEFSKRSFRDLVALCHIRKNLMPILADARSPESYERMTGIVDIIYQDVSQRDQAAIFLKNIPLLKQGGLGILMLKSRSVDMAKEPGMIYREVANELTSGGLEVLKVIPLDPLEKDHAAIIARRT